MTFVPDETFWTFAGETKKAGAYRRPRGKSVERECVCELNRINSHSHAHSHYDEWALQSDSWYFGLLSSVCGMMMLP
jgi:hypothetical protein